MIYWLDNAHFNKISLRNYSASHVMAEFCFTIWLGSNLLVVKMCNNMLPKWSQHCHFMYIFIHDEKIIHFIVIFICSFLTSMMTEKRGNTTFRIILWTVPLQIVPFQVDLVGLVTEYCLMPTYHQVFQNVDNDTELIITRSERCMKFCIHLYGFRDC